MSRLIALWKDQGLSLAKGNSEARLAEFETKNAVHLPPDMRQYLAVANGMLNIPGSDCDANGFRFWPLDEVRSVPEVCSESGVTIPAGEALDKHFVFADYLQWSWAYAIDLSGRDRGCQPIIHVGTLEPKTVAQSFCQFIELYLKDAPDLYVLSQPQRQS
ncbi:MAG: SMI1/KNR4 family protein [Acidobacteriota bacterium]